MTNFTKMKPPPLIEPQQELFLRAFDKARAKFSKRKSTLKSSVSHNG
ncbi:hypothetical protein [Halomonas sp. N3-2A]|nr:hypothetical protein [Halomonas sp. N3-2A]